MYQLTASIVLYKNDMLVERAIQSFLDCTLKTKLLLIDNSPTETLNQTLAKYINNEKVEYFFNNNNAGFGAGHNIAFKKIIDQSPYHLLLNPDIYFEKNVLESLIAYMNEHKDIGLLMPKILYEDGSTQYLAKLLPTPFDYFLRRYLPFAFKKMQDRFILKKSGYDKLMNVPFLSGCFMILNTSALKDVGFFDEKIFMYTEDTDLSRRITAKYRTIFYPYQHVYHLHEKKSFSDLHIFMVYLRSAIYYFNKWGWFLDKERTRINKATLDQFK